MKKAFKQLVITVFASKKGLTWLLSSVLLTLQFKKMVVVYNVPTNDLWIFLSLITLLCITLGVIAFKEIVIELKKS